MSQGSKYSSARLGKRLAALAAAILPNETAKNGTWFKRRLRAIGRFVAPAAAFAHVSSYFAAAVVVGGVLCAVVAVLPFGGADCVAAAGEPATPGSLPAKPGASGDATPLVFGEQIEFSDEQTQRKLAGRMVLVAQDGGWLFQGRDGVLWAVPPGRQLGRAPLAPPLPGRAPSSGFPSPSASAGMFAISAAVSRETSGLEPALEGISSREVCPGAARTSLAVSRCRESARSDAGGGTALPLGSAESAESSNRASLAVPTARPSGEAAVWGDNPA